MLKCVQKSCYALTRDLANTVEFTLIAVYSALALIQFVVVCTYRVTLKTTDVMHAGTNDSIYVNIGCNEKIKLNTNQIQKLAAMSWSAVTKRLRVKN